MDWKPILISLVILCSFANIIYAQDTLFLKEQSPIVGRLSKINKGKIHFVGDVIGSLRVDIRDVNSIYADRYGYRVRTLDKDFFAAQRFSPHEDDGKIKIFLNEDDEEGIPIDISTLNNVKLIRNNFIDRIDGEIGLGYTYTRNSRIGRWNGELDFVYEAKKNDIELRAEFIFTQDNLPSEDGSIAREREIAEIIHKYYLGPKLNSFALLKYQRNLELNILQRFQQSVGMGFEAYKSNNVLLLLKSGIALNQETSVERDRRTGLFEVPLIVDFELFRLRQPDISVSMGQAFFKGITQWGRTRVDGETKVKWRAFGDFEMKASFYNNFDNMPPGGASSNFDYGMSLGLSYSF